MRTRLCIYVLWLAVPISNLSTIIAFQEDHRYLIVIWFDNSPLPFKTRWKPLNYIIIMRWSRKIRWLNWIWDSIFLVLPASSNARKLIERIGVYLSQTRNGEASLKNKVAIPQSRRREMKRVFHGLVHAFRGASLKILQRLITSGFPCDRTLHKVASFSGQNSVLWKAKFDVIRSKYGS